MLGDLTTISVYPFYLQLQHHCPVSRQVEGECWNAIKKINCDFTTLETYFLLDIDNIDTILGLLYWAQQHNSR